MEQSGTRAPRPLHAPPLRCRVCGGGCYATASAIDIAWSIWVWFGYEYQL